MSRIIVSLSGKMETGKDTVADILVENYNFKKLSFAKNLKKMCQSVFEITEEDTDTMEGKFRQFSIPVVFTEKHMKLILAWMNKTHVTKTAEDKIKNLEKAYVQNTEFNTSREILQFVGTEICRAICQSYHIDIIEEKIVCNKDINYVLADARFPNERKMLKKHGAILGLTIRNTGKENDSHASEKSLGKAKDYDYVIDNNMSIPKLKKWIKNLMFDLELKKDKIL